MAGPMTHVNYLADNGTTYRIAMPTWVQAVTGDAAATATVGIPKGMRVRKRYIKDNTTGKEHKFTVGDKSLSAWTSGFGATVTGLTVIPGVSTTTFSYQGRRGENDFIRG